MTTRHIVYMDVRKLEPADRNPKDHDLPTIIALLRRFGFRTPAELDERTGKLLAGHGRRQAVMRMWENGEPPPAGVIVDDDGEWLVPVLRGGTETVNDTEAEAYIIGHNKSGESGGWINRTLAEMLEDVITEDAPLQETLGFSFDDIDELLRKIDPETIGEQDPDKPQSSGAPDPDPHMALSDGDESVDDCEACRAGRVCLRHASGVLTADDLDGLITCPSCSHRFEDPNG